MVWKFWLDEVNERKMDGDTAEALKAAQAKLDDKIKAQEKAFKAHMDAKKDEAKAVMDRMLAGSDTGLMALTMQNWKQYVNDEKKAKELEFALSQADAKFKSLNGRQKAG